MNHNHESKDVHQSGLKINWILVAFLAIAGFFLLMEHRAHVLGFLPYILLLACPLMHLFHHHGHGHHGHSNDSHPGAQGRDGKGPQKGDW